MKQERAQRKERLAWVMSSCRMIKLNNTPPHSCENKNCQTDRGLGKFDLAAIYL